MEVINTNAYKLELPANLSRLHPVFNISRLRPYKESNPVTFPDREVLDRPLPTLEDENDGYEVEVILDKMRTTRQGRYTTWYLVKWKGYPDSDATWRKAAWLKPPHAGSGVWEFVQQYNAAHPGAGRIERDEPTVS